MQHLTVATAEGDAAGRRAEFVECLGRFNAFTAECNMEYEMEGSRPRGRPKRTWTDVVQKDCQARNLNREDAMDRGRWKKLIKIG